MHRPKFEAKKTKWIVQKFVYNLQSWAFVYLVDTLWIEFVCGFLLLAYTAFDWQSICRTCYQYSSYARWICKSDAIHSFAFEFVDIRIWMKFTPVFFLIRERKLESEAISWVTQIRCHWIDLFFIFFSLLTLLHNGQNKIENIFLDSGDI